VKKTIGFPTYRFINNKEIGTWGIASTGEVQSGVKRFEAGNYAKIKRLFIYNGLGKILIGR
jgi:hypothetical protein